MNYHESVRSLLALGLELAAPRQARVQKFDLENIRTLARHLGEPQTKFPSVHIAGTNGKGSTAAMLEGILRESGLKTGLYISPHLERINERISIAGQEISDDEFARSFARIHNLIEQLLARGELAAHPTYFECLTAMAFESFAQAKVDIAVLEVGMGGRLDATNIVVPQVSIITQIDYDHEDYLGHSIEQIAAEKAAIIKPGVPVVLAIGRPRARVVAERRAAEVGAPVIVIDRDFRLEQVRAVEEHYCASAVHVESGERFDVALPLAGRYQLRNAVAAIAAARVLGRRGFPVSRKSIERGLGNVQWPGRLEKMSRHPDVYLDGSHNPAGARELLDFWDRSFANRRIILIYGAMRDKAVDEVCGLLFPRASRVILTEPRQKRSISVQALSAMTAHLAQHVDLEADPAKAVTRALELAHPDEVIFITGSLYLVGDLRRFLRELPGHVPPPPA